MVKMEVQRSLELLVLLDEKSYSFINPVKTNRRSQDFKPPHVVSQIGRKDGNSCYLNVIMFHMYEGGCGDTTTSKIILMPT